MTIASPAVTDRDLESRTSPGQPAAGSPNQSIAAFGETATSVAYADASSATDRVGPEFYDAIYAQAQGDRARVPWDEGQASRALINWLNAVAPSLIRCGSRVAVIGCGLGHDARELLKRGYEVTAFDCSPNAIAWAQRNDPENAACYVCADLFEPHPRWRHRFDLVVEVNTLQSLPPDRQGQAMQSIAELISPHGHLLVIAASCDHSDDDDNGAGQPVSGPPWPISSRSLLEAASLAGLTCDGDVCCFDDDSTTPATRRIRGLFCRT